MSKISVIIAVYRAEKYLARCLDSLLGQTFSDFEVVLIDDGSPDSSGQICEQYAVKDSRFKVYHKPNGGVASARELGLKMASGEYSIHLDPDDWVEADMLEQLYHQAVEQQVDVVYCDAYVHQGDMVHYHKQNFTEEGVLLDVLHDRVWCSLVVKLVRMECYRRYDIHFDEGFNHGEDYLVSAKLFSHKEVTCAYLPKAFYHYIMYENENSITNKRDKGYSREDFDYDCKYFQLLKPYLPSAEECDYQEAKNIFRAFSFNIFNAKEFKTMFYPKRKMFIKQMGRIKGSLLYLSAIGFGGLSYMLFNSIRRVKKAL